MPTLSRSEALNNLGFDSTENPSIDTIKSKYKKLALKFHPDKNKSPEAQIQFQKIHEALTYLTDLQSLPDPSISSYMAPEQIRYNFIYQCKDIKVSKKEYLHGFTASLNANNISDLNSALLRYFSQAKTVKIYNPLNPIKIDEEGKELILDMLLQNKNLESYDIPCFNESQNKQLKESISKNHSPVKKIGNAISRIIQFGIQLTALVVNVVVMLTMGSLMLGGLAALGIYSYFKGDNSNSNNKNTSNHDFYHFSENTQTIPKSSRTFLPQQSTYFSDRLFTEKCTSKKSTKYKVH